MSTERNVRDLLTELGIGQFNATMIIQYMMIGPFTTDPKSPMIMLLVQHIQRALIGMGAPVRESGALDRQTADALTELLGRDWINGDWSDVVIGVLAAKRSGYRFQRTAKAAPVSLRMPAPSLAGAFDFLPDVPGGILTYAAGAALLWHVMKKKRKG